MSSAQAQDKIESYGKISMADMKMTTCDFDPDAGALCLFDVGEVYYNLSERSVDIKADFRKRVKILNEKGIEEANIKIRYYSKDRFEEISNMSGIVYNLDAAGNIVTTKLEKELIYDKKIDSRYSEISFAFPNVKAGSVVEYKYKSFKKNNIADIDDWYFQSHIPVRYSAYNLLIPEYFDFTFKSIHRQPMDYIKSKSYNDGDWYIMRNIPALKNEPYMSGFKDYLQRVDFQLAAINPPNGIPISHRTTWDKLTEELLESETYGKQLYKNVPGSSSILKAILAGITDPEKKINLIYKFVQSNMSWNGNYARSSFDGIKDAWDKKSGNTGDINLLLVNLLKDNNIDAYPLLVSTRDNGLINQFFPFLEQFDATYVFAEIGDKYFVLNAADKYNPYNIYPYDVQLTYAFIVNKKRGGIITISDPSKKLKHNIALFIGVDENGEVSGNASVSSYEYAKNIRTKTYREGRIKEIFSDNEGIKLAIDSIVVNNDRNDSLPLLQKVYFKGSVQTSGEYGFLPYNLFSGLAKNPFTAENRVANIDFGYNQSYTISGAYSIADNYQFDELPKNVKMILPDSSIILTRVLQKSENLVNFRVTIQFLRAQYDVEEYPDVKEAYKKLYALLNEHIVIRKKIKS